MKTKTDFVKEDHLARGMRMACGLPTELSEHTITPWHVTPNGGIAGDGEVIVCNSVETLNKYGGTPMNNGFGKAQANAEFICRAVNSHDALLAACQELLSMVDELLPLAPKGCRWGTLATDDARVAIAQATGNELARPAVSENLDQPLN